MLCAAKIWEGLLQSVDKHSILDKSFSLTLWLRAFQNQNC